MIAAPFPTALQRAKTMLPVYLKVDVVMDRVALNNRWASEQWQPASVVPVGEGRGAAASPECILDTDARTSWLFAGMEIELHRAEGEGYYLNLTSDTPVVFVLWRTYDDGTQPVVRPLIVTLSYNEAGRFMDGGEHVDPVPMADSIRDWLAAFVAANYKPEPRKKMRRNDPFAADAERSRGGR